MESSIITREDFDKFVESVEARDGYRRPRAFGIGIAHTSESDTVLDTFFPFPNLECNYGAAAVLADAVNHLSGTATYWLATVRREKILACFAPFLNDGKKHDNINALQELFSVSLNMTYNSSKIVVSFIDQPEYDEGPKTVSDAYLRLHLLSHRLVKPNEIKLDDIVNVLPNNVWTNEGPISLEDFPKRRYASMMRRHSLQVTGVDKFPRMVDYVIPSGVRIADSAHVCLGAYLGEGTVVTAEGSCGFNAGTLGASLVAGHISSGAIVHAGTDIGPNAGTDISLGDHCVIEAGLYITANMPVLHCGNRLRARDLSKKGYLMFRRNGLTGHVEALNRPDKVVSGEELHKN